MKKFTLAVTAAFFISTAGTPAQADVQNPPSVEQSLRTAARRELCLSLKEGIRSGNVTIEDALSRLHAYDCAGKS